MSISVITGTSAGSANTNDVTTGSQDTSGANFGICSVADYDQATVPITVTDNKNGGSWTPLTAYSSAFGGVREQFFYIINPIVGSGHTVTATGTFGFPAISTLWLGGVDTSSPFDGENGSGGTTITILQVGLTQPTVDTNEITISGVGWTIATGATLSINQGFTINSSIDYSAGVNFGSAIAYLLNTPGGGTNPTWTLDSTPRDIAASDTVWKQSTAGPVATIVRLLASLGVGR